jgi:hypothetical protein
MKSAEEILSTKPCETSRNLNSPKYYRQSIVLNVAKEYAQQYKDRVAELEKEREWISVEERLPGDEYIGKDVLVNIKYSNMQRTQVVEWFSEEIEGEKPFFNLNVSFCGQQIVHKKITHWMPLPKNPSLPQPTKHV